MTLHTAELQGMYVKHGDQYVMTFFLPVTCPPVLGKGMLSKLSGLNVCLEAVFLTTESV